MELLMLVVGIVLLWKFSSVLNTLAVMLRSTTQVQAEKIIGDAVIDRSENFEAFKHRTEGKNLYSHGEIMQHFRVDE